MADTATRPASALDAVADGYLEAAAAHDPLLATAWGLPGHDHALPAFTPDWYAERSRMRTETLAAARRCEAVDATDRVTLAALAERVDTEEALRDTGAEESSLNVLDSPVQAVREVFDLMPVATAEDWATVATRLAAVPDALAGYLTSLRWAAARGHVSARRQVSAAAAQCDGNTGTDGFFAGLVADAPAAAGVPASLQADLERGAQVAGAAYAELAAALRDELLPQAPERDAIGRELYPLHSRAFLGTTVDIDETYAWGQDELARIRTEMASVAERIRPGASVAEAMTALDTDPERRLDGTAALQAWMQRTSDAAVTALAGTHFDIPDAIRTLECRIAPTATGGIYYTGPSEDLTTRPGRMWWSVPEGVTDFSTWRERTTVYHEGVPGHHLQVAQTVYRSGLLNRWRRIGLWLSGHGEGWALYAERLMADLGFLDDPGDRLGMLDGQSLRAARVVLDLGVHCELPAPASLGGGPWTYDKAWAFLQANASGSEGLLRFELDRYLGWPGQAPSYKLGEREWLRLRDDARAAAGSAFDLAAFHRRALDLGSLGLDVLRAAVLETA